LAGLTFPSDPNVIRGVESRDNAGVYRLGDHLAIVQTVDFFTPVVDDPYDFGRIAVANSLSDIYTMGARPITAMNVVCFPRDTLDILVLREVLRGGSDKLSEAGVALVGGHSVDDPEFKFGLSVTGVIDPDKMVTNGDARVGDKLILTKPLGLGIISTALKSGAAPKKLIERVTAIMAELNATASQLMLKAGVHSCTDITGFGFIGHALQMADNSGVGFSISAAALPVLTEALVFGGAGFLSGGLEKNREYYSPSVSFGPAVNDKMRNVMFDPQTSGGLLMSVPALEADGLLAELKGAGIKDASIVGEVVAEPRSRLVVS
jgi:selenide, water dikinase